MVFLTLEFLPPSHPLLSHQCKKHRCSYDLVTKLPHRLAEKFQALNVANKALWPLNSVWPLQHHLLPPPVSCTEPHYTFLSVDVPQLCPFLLIICWSADSPTSVTSEQSQGLSPPSSCVLWWHRYSQSPHVLLWQFMFLSLALGYESLEGRTRFQSFLSPCHLTYQFLGIVFFVFCIFNDSLTLGLLELPFCSHFPSTLLDQFSTSCRAAPSLPFHISNSGQ